MAMTAAEIQYTFKVFGKAVRLGIVGGLTADEYESFSSVTFRQISPSGINKEYDEVKYVGQPVQQAVESVAQLGDSLVASMKQAVSGYLQNSLCLDLGLPVGSNPNTVAAALSAEMTLRSQSVHPSGSFGSNSAGFAMYFYNNFGTSLPQNAVPTCPDTWITSVMVP